MSRGCRSAGCGAGELSESCLVNSGATRQTFPFETRNRAPRGRRIHKVDEGVRRIQGGAHQRKYLVDVGGKVDAARAG